MVRDLNKNVDKRYQRSKQNMHQPVAWKGNMVIDLNLIDINQLPWKVTWSKVQTKSILTKPVAWEGKMVIDFTKFIATSCLGR